MKDINFKEKILPHLIAVVVFFLVVVVFYLPVFLENKEIKQNDVLQSKGSVQEILDYREKTGEEALWTNSVFSGMPGYLIQVNYSGDFSLTLIKIFSLGLSHPAGQTFTAFISFYILLLVFGVRPFLAITGALAFGFTSFSIISIEAGHNAKGLAMAFMPLIISGIHLTFKKEWYLGFILTSLGMAMHLRANHLQVTYYMLFILGIYGLILLIDRIRNHSVTNLVKPVLVIFAAVLLAVGTHTGRLWGVYEYSKFSTRGASELTDPNSQGDQGESGLTRDYVFAWSHSIWEPFTLLIPNFYGGGSQHELDMQSEFAKELRKNGYSPVQIRQQVKGAPTYWGELPFTSGAIYGGAIIIFLFLIGSFLVENLLYS